MVQGSVRVTTRPLTSDDASAVRQLDQLILGADRSSSWDEYMDRFLAMSRLSYATRPWWGSQVAEVDGRVAGFILAERQSAGYGLPPGARIVAIAVHPEFRRMGVGGRLMEALKADCRRQGISQIYSLLEDEDRRDAEFLEACGFDAAKLKVYMSEV